MAPVDGCSRPFTVSMEVTFGRRTKRAPVLQKVKRGELRAVLTRTGRRKGLRIEIPAPQEGLF